MLEQQAGLNLGYPNAAQGANNFVLEGVFHSMGTNKKWAVEHRWYGSEDVVDHWAHCFVKQ